MPNWAEGNIRLRGKRENIINFIKNEIVAVYEHVDMEHADYNEYGELLGAPVTYEYRPVTLEENGDCMKIRRDQDTRENFYFKESRRQFLFVEGYEFEVYFSEGRNLNKDTVVVIEGFNAAWDIDDLYFSRLAKDYKIDIRIFVGEQGMCWTSFRTFYRNGEQDSVSKSYSDWMWDCPMPYLGG